VVEHFEGRSQAAPPFSRRINPEDVDRVAQAKDFRERFHWGHPARGKPRRVHVDGAPRVLVKLGSLQAVTYGTNKRGDGYSHYEHHFGEEGGKKPALCMDVDTGRLHIVGGDYTVEERGIVD
jgi:hypothetical protein